MHASTSGAACSTLPACGAQLSPRVRLLGRQTRTLALIVRAQRRGPTGKALHGRTQAPSRPGPAHRHLRCSSDCPGQPDYAELGPPSPSDGAALQMADMKVGELNKASNGTQTPPATATASTSHLIRGFHIVAFFLVLGVGLVFLTFLLYSTGDIQFRLAATKVVKRLMKTVALPQVVAILSAMMFVRFGLEPLVRSLRGVFRAQGAWEKSTEFFVLREVYRPLEVLFLIAAAVTLAENFLPQLIAIPKALVQSVVRSTLGLTFVLASSRVVYNIKGRMFREAAWQLELKGDVTRQRRIEAIDKLMSVLIIVVGSVFGLQALGLDVNSVLAIGGIGGLAVGLAGREILENLFTGLIILSSSPFEVGEEVLFRQSSGQVIEGIVMDVGWYRTTIRSFEREVFCIPNAAFSRNVVLNVTRKGKEWRFYEFIALRVDDLKASSAVVADMRKIIRQDPRIIQKLHRRVFLDKITRDEISIYISFYVEAANRDAFMAIKQDLMLAFVDCVERNNAKLARNRLQIEVGPALQPELRGPAPGGSGEEGDLEGDAVAALPGAVDVAATTTVPTVSPSGPTSPGGGGGAKPGALGAGPVPGQGGGEAAAEAGAKKGKSGSGARATVALGGVAAGDPNPLEGTALGSLVGAAAGSSSAQVSQQVMSKLAVALTPDDILSNTSQDGGVLITGSWDEL